MNEKTLDDFSPCPGCNSENSVEERHIGTGRLGVDNGEQLYIKFAWCKACNGAWALKPISAEDFKKLLCEVGLTMNEKAGKMPKHELMAEKSVLRPEVHDIALRIEGKLRTHDKVKGDSWKGMSPLDLQALVVRKLGEMMNTSDPEEAMSKCVSMMALTMMLRSQLENFILMDKFTVGQSE